MKKHIFCLFLLLPTIAMGQSIDRDVVSSSGDSFDDGSIIVSWTLGEISIETFKEGDFILTQGFQQGNLEVSAVQEVDIDFVLKAYPNPVSDILIIENNCPDAFYQIVDSNGKVIQNGILETNCAEIDFTTCKTGIYFLWIEGSQTHKIVKN